MRTNATVNERRTPGPKSPSRRPEGSGQGLMRSPRRSAWFCTNIVDGGSRCNGWGMTTERRCRKCGAPRPFPAHELMVGQARHVRCCERRSEHALRGNRWSPASSDLRSECSLRIYSAASASRKAIARLRDRFDLPAATDDMGYLHIEWQDPPRLAEQNEQVDYAATSNPIVREMLIRTSSIQAQVVLMRQPELLADGAGKVELLMELSSTPRASDDVVAAQLAHHHHPTHEHGLFSVIVCFEALAALAPVLRLDSQDHPPNHRRLERWLVHIPPWAYSRHTRAWTMWTVHTLLPFATVMWGLWQLYFNIDVVNRAVNDAFRMASEHLERIVGPMLSTVSLVIVRLNAGLIDFTQQFNVWLRPLKMVLQPLATAGFTAGRALVTPLRILVGLGVQLVQPVWSIIITLLGALAEPLQYLFSMIVEPLRALAESLQPVWSFVRSAARTMGTHTARIFVQIQKVASVVFNVASEGLVRLATASGSAVTCIKSSPIGKVWQLIASKLSLVMKFKPQTETKVIAAHINKLAKNVKPVARAAAQMSEGVISPLDSSAAREEINLREARKESKAE